MKPITAAIITALIIAVAVLGYLYYDAEYNKPKVQIKLPGVTIEGN